MPPKDLMIPRDEGTAIEVTSLTKSFRYFPSPLDRLREAFSPFGTKHHVPVSVLRDVSFTIPRGESVAIIGPNGAGKSTLLHLIAGLIQPSAGTVAARGRVQSLLDLGGNFLFDLTGRENARFQHEVAFREAGNWDEREQVIREFAGIGEFFDRPVRTYSLGMLLRLAFATAVSEEPDILLLDEVLAVGDARFQQKCFRRIRELRDRGTTIVIVTHHVDGLPAICDRVLVLDHNELVFNGGAGEGVDRYYQLFFMSPGLSARDASTDEHRHGDAGARIVNCFATHDGVAPVTSFAAGEVVKIVADIEFARAVEAPQIGFTCATREGVRVYTTSSGMLGEAPEPAHEGERRRVDITFTLAVGVTDLFIDISLFEVAHGTFNVLDARLGVLHLVVTSPRHFAGITDLSAMIRTERFE